MPNAGNKQAAIKVEIGHKSYPNVNGEESLAVIENLRFSQVLNEFTCLVGPSGCGKTSLLNIIAGLDDDYDGVVEIAGKQHSTATSYVFQQPRLLPWRTVFENIQLCLPKTPASKQLIEQLLKTLGIAEVGQRYPQHLSLGMARRVALARAFAGDSRLLLLDEPFVSLDNASANIARKLLLDLWADQPRNILFVTHDLSEAIGLADRIIFLSESPCQLIADVKVTLARDARTADNISGYKQDLLSNNTLAMYR